MLIIRYNLLCYIDRDKNFANIDILMKHRLLTTCQEAKLERPKYLNFPSETYKKGITFKIQNHVSSWDRLEDSSPIFVTNMTVLYCFLTRLTESYNVPLQECSWTLLILTLAGQQKLLISINGMGLLSYCIIYCPSFHHSIIRDWENTLRCKIM